ncbi:MAG: hypothetical protein J6T73_05870 [Clostridia bacterium]|nr:hypothetical protein [Clostridia bacterium]
MTCTFFGHSYISADISASLEDALVYLIEKKGVNKFYVGTHGSFDRQCFEMLEKLAEKYDIDYKKVLSTVPSKRAEWDKTDYSRAVVPDGIEKAHPRFRINFRNKWMINNSDYVVTYIKNPFGTGAAQFAALAEKKGKIMIKLGDY